MADNTPRELAPAEEEQRISRSIMAWINTYTNLPVAIVNFEQLRADAASMAVSTIQAAYIVRRYITGGHEGEYQFKLIYRLKPGNSNDERLKADELLNAIADWARSNKPSLGSGVRVIKCEATTRGGLFAVYENGDEDHQILFKLNYEVN